MSPPTERCGYVYTGEEGHESCCYRKSWQDSDRCIWHEEVTDDVAKPVETLQSTRAPSEVREQNGGNGPREILDGADVRDVNFPDGIDFAEVSLRDGDLEEVTLREADLSGADLSDTILVDADLRRADLSEAVCWEVELNDGHLAGANLESADLHESDCSDAVFRGANLHNANLEGAFFNRADLFDADLTGTRNYGVVFSEARANEGTELDEWCVYDPHNESQSERTTKTGVQADGGTASDPSRTDKHQEISQLSKAEGAYQELESLCAENALLKPQSRYFVRRQDIHTTEHRREGNWSRWVRARISRAVVLYGESPFRVLAVAGLVILGSALLYPLGLLRSSSTGQLVTYPAPTQPVALIQTLAESLYFSTLTFTTMTFGLFRPVGVGKFLTMVETGAGIVLMALLVFVFGRRATR